MKSIQLLPKYLLIGVLLATLTAGVTTTILYLVYRDALFRVVNVAVDTNRAVLTDRVGGNEPDVMESLAAKLASAVARSDDALCPPGCTDHGRCSGSSGLGCADLSSHSYQFIRRVRRASSVDGREVL